MVDFDCEAENRFNILIKREGLLFTNAKARDDKKEKRWKESKKDKVLQVCSLNNFLCKRKKKKSLL